MLPVNAGFKQQPSVVLRRREARRANVGNGLQVSARWFQYVYPAGPSRALNDEVPDSFDMNYMSNCMATLRGSNLLEHPKPIGGNARHYSLADGGNVQEAEMPGGCSICS